jgi:hypothetical protein
MSTPPTFCDRCRRRHVSGECELDAPPWWKDSTPETIRPAPLLPAAWIVGSAIDDVGSASDVDVVILGRREIPELEARVREALAVGHDGRLPPISIHRVDTPAFWGVTEADPSIQISGPTTALARVPRRTLGCAMREWLLVGSWPAWGDGAEIADVGGAIDIALKQGRLPRLILAMGPAWFRMLSAASASTGAGVIQAATTPDANTSWVAAAEGAAAPPVSVHTPTSPPDAPHADLASAIADLEREIAASRNPEGWRRTLSDDGTGRLLDEALDADAPAGTVASAITAARQSIEQIRAGDAADRAELGPWA